MEATTCMCICADCIDAELPQPLSGWLLNPTPPVRSQGGEVHLQIPAPLSDEHYKRDISGSSSSVSSQTSYINR